MARAIDQSDNSCYLTEYVTTRWYRAPEVMISNQNYSTASKLTITKSILFIIKKKKINLKKLTSGLWVVYLLKY